jgi:hypothetical protein
MSKDKISDYSTTANSNTDIGGINVDEGCAPSGINDAIRTLMAQLKTWQSGGQDVYIHPAGSASAPSITANGDTNTGIFFPAADTVGITTGGTERARVDSSGNLGLGVTPSAWSGVKALEIAAAGSGIYSFGSTDVRVTGNAYWNGSAYKYGATNLASMYVQNAGVHYWYNAASGTAGNSISFTNAMTLNANGALVLQGGNTSASGVGVAFPATQSASSDANTLDDYEEGTWTPNQGSGLTVNGSFSSVGRYIKIGRIVYVEGTLAGSVNIASSASSVLFTNLPFTSQSGSASGLGGVTNNALNLSNTCWVSSGSTTVYGLATTTATSVIWFSVTYQASA